MVNRIKIHNKYISDDDPVFIIAEAGVNHNGSVELAKKLIDTAVEAGADAVKFQTFKTEKVISKNAPKAEYQKQTTGDDESQFDMVKKLELSESDHYVLLDYAKQKGIIFLSTPFDDDSLNLLVKMGVPAIKVGSGELTNLPFLKLIAKTNLPIILSTGMSYLGEIEKALDVIYSEGNEQVILLHCVSNYPPAIEDSNLNAIQTMRQAFKIPVGYSDHTEGIEVSLAAVAIGACVIEKHFTLDKSLPGPDHLASLNPDELKAMVSGIRKIEKAMGDGIKRPTKSEIDVRKVARRSIVAKIEIPEGTIIQDDMLAIKRPGTGIEPALIDLVIGKKAKKKIDKDEVISWETLFCS